MGIGKYVAAALALAAMIWSWNLSHDDAKVGLEQRRAIESALEDSIVQYIKARKPAISEIIFQQLYSEDVPASPEDQNAGTHETLVRFRYLTNEPGADGEMTEQTFEGSVRLRSKDRENWEWVDENVQSPLIKYKKGTTVQNSPDFSAPGQ